jgi:alpha-1,3-rhamnosyl/mannosyltransferase
MKKEKIILEGLALVEGHFSGVGQYTLGILRGLDEEIDSLKYKGKEWPEVTVLIPWNMVDRFKSFKFKHIGYKKFPLTFRVMSKLWYSGLMPPIDIWCGRGFYVFPRFGKMPLLFSKYAVVVYDLSYELYPQYSDKGSAEFISKVVKKSIPKAFKVITISDNAQKEIVEFYKLSKDSVPVATPAADQRVFYRRSDQEIAKVKGRYGIEQDYILALSNLEPRKNLRVLVDAYCALPEKIRAKNALLLVGVSGWKTDALFNHITEKVKEGYNIIRPSHYVSDEDKPAILSGAKMLVYPSHYEGFGMPPLEALACGTPVISANNSSLPQAVGSAGIMVNVEDEKEILSAIEGCLHNYDKVAADVLTTGPRQAEKFSWVNSARVPVEKLCRSSR